MSGAHHHERHDNERARDEIDRTVASMQPFMIRRALFLTRDREAARDLVQSTVERAYRSLHRFEAGTSPTCWLNTIMTNSFIDQLRRSRLLKWSPLPDEERLPAPDPDAEPTWWNRFDIADVKAAARQLPGPFRRPFELHAFDRLSYRQIARRLRLPMGTVGTRIFRARQALKQVLLDGRWVN